MSDHAARQCFISIVMPVLNEAEVIATRIGELKHLRKHGYELIVVDGGSHDGAADRAVAADLVLVSARGRARQMNAGAHQANGQFLLFLHADTQLPPDVADVLAPLAQASEPRWGRFDVRLDSPAWWARIIETAMNLRSRWTAVATGDQAMFVHRDLFAAVGGFEDIPLMEDIALSKALRRRSSPLCLRARVRTSARRWQRHGVVRTVLLMWRLRLAYWLGVPPAKLALQYAER
ncbi:MAG: TIGR04283 family arsenosugar biosynthesis glycosyltransferase [Gammaproteobacteria bacterium]|nr:TIGR04283 family arsenosugar biosynthesis glycosyltransferase [Gammaproteobacteria bacterium]